MWGAVLASIPHINQLSSLPLRWTTWTSHSPRAHGEKGRATHPWGAEPLHTLIIGPPRVRPRTWSVLIYCVSLLRSRERQSIDNRAGVHTRERVLDMWATV